MQESRPASEDENTLRDGLDAERRALEVERERLRALFDLVPDAYLITDAEGVVRELNRKASSLLGEPDQALSGRPLSDLVPESVRSVLSEMLASLRESGEGIERELTLGSGRTASRRVRAVVAPAVDGGRTVALRWLLRESSSEPPALPAGQQQLLREQAARMHAEAAGRREAFLSEASEILAGSLEHELTLASVARLAVPRIANSCIVYVIEDGGSVRRLGAAHADPGKEEILRRLLDHRPFDAESLTRPVARALRTGEPELIPDVPPYEADPFIDDPAEVENAAALSPRSLMVVPLKVRDRVLGALSLGWTECGKYTPDDLWLARKLADRAALAIENARLHREARRASEAKSDFVAAMSHEFRTPLTAILAFADMLVAGIPEPISGVPLRHAERIVSAAKHLGELIDQVLTLSRIEAGRDRVQPETVDLKKLVRDTAALVEPIARQKALPLVVEVPEQEVVMETDANKLRQVLFNLLGNAVKFTEQGEIRVALLVDGERVTVEVHDTGEGIAPEQLERIWEPFWRATRLSGDHPPGTGLGLGIVKRLVHMLGGEIRAWSEPGRGSIFAVELHAARGVP